MSNPVLSDKCKDSVKDLIERKYESNKYFMSLEITTNLKRSDIRDNPILKKALFVSIVWSGKLAKFKMREREVHLSELFDLLRILKYENISTLIHLTCYEMNDEKLKYILEKLPEFNIQDILALRGDGNEFTNYQTALELIDAINNKTSVKYFNIAAAGYPQGHPESISGEQNYDVLLRKVAAGAEFVITQFFFDAEYFIDFVENCHQKYGIHIKIIPGILLAPSFECLQKISHIANVPLPTSLLNTRGLSNELFQEYFTVFVVKLVTRVLKHNYTKCQICNFKQIAGVHFFTLNNLEIASRVCELLKEQFQFYK